MEETTTDISSTNDETTMTEYDTTLETTIVDKYNIIAETSAINYSEQTSEEIVAGTDTMAKTTTLATSTDTPIATSMVTLQIETGIVNSQEKAFLRG